MPRKKLFRGDKSLNKAAFDIIRVAEAGRPRTAFEIAENIQSDKADTQRMLTQSITEYRA
jgi:hypothetical protein